MGSLHDSHNQPLWGHHCNAPAPSSVPNASAGGPSCSTHIQYPAPPTRYPPVSQQYLPPAHPAPHHHQQLDAGIFPPSSSGYHALPLGSQKTSYIPPAAKFRQKVKARITTDAWVIGIIVGALQVCSKFTGLRYNVQFESVEGSGQYETRDFSPEDLSPYRPREPEYPNRSR